MVVGLVSDWGWVVVVRISILVCLIDDGLCIVVVFFGFNGSVIVSDCCLRKIYISVVYLCNCVL